MHREHWTRADRPDIHAEELTDEEADELGLDPDLGDEYHPFKGDGIQICPRCGAHLWPPVEPIVTLGGRRYDDPLASDPGTIWFCPACWKARDLERRAIENVTLIEFVEEADDGDR